MPITTDDRTSIIERITPIFDEVIGEYDFKKYPADDYQHFKNTFSFLPAQNNEIENAMIW
ncbi:MAG: hypothetical protein GVY20_01545, partial [Bacteroidetes bacterium]|nr:hypothetical protein [Bacteroidota bacterium]